MRDIDQILHTGTNKSLEIEKLISAAQDIWNGGHVHATIYFDASEQLTDAINEAMQKSITTIFITDSTIRHIMKTHGNNEHKRSQIDVCPADFALLPEIFNHFDTIRHSGIDKLGQSKFVFSKTLDCTMYLATVQKGKRKLEIKTFWKRRVSGASC